MDPLDGFLEKLLEALRSEVEVALLLVELEDLEEPFMEPVFLPGILDGSVELLELLMLEDLPDDHSEPLELISLKVLELFVDLLDGLLLPLLGVLKLFELLELLELLRLLDAQLESECPSPMG